MNKERNNSRKKVMPFPRKLGPGQFIGYHQANLMDTTHLAQGLSWVFATDAHQMQRMEFHVLVTHNILNIDFKPQNNHLEYST